MPNLLVRDIMEEQDKEFWLFFSINLQKATPKFSGYYLSLKNFFFKLK